MANTLVLSQSTWLKTRLAQSEGLGHEEKQWMSKSASLPLKGCRLERGHYAIELATPINGQSKWYVFAKHGVINQDHPLVIPESHVLDVGYRSQRDNEINPDGACNVTCVAMVLDYFKVPRRHYNYKQFEDELYDFMAYQGLDRHSPYDLVRVIQAYGAVDVFHEEENGFHRIKAHIASGNPVIFHGYFTSAGHIVVAIGYDADGFIIHDPFGEWNDYGYLKNDSSDPEIGKSQHYSYDMIDQTCGPDGKIWVHFCSPF